MSWKAKLSCMAILLTAAVVFPAGESFAAFEPIRGISESQVKRVAVSPVNPRVVGVATNKNLYLSTDAGDNFRSISEFSAPINHMIFDKQWPEAIYVGTEKGLFRVKDMSSEMVYEADEKEEVLTMKQHRGKTYVGTTRGLFSSNTGDWDWEAVRDSGSKLAITDVEPAEDRLLFAANDGVYSLDLEAGEVSQLHTIQRSQPYSEIEKALNEDQDFVQNARNEGQLVPFELETNLFDGKTIFLGTSEGIFRSSDNGSSWDRFSINGMSNLEVRSIAQTPDWEDVLYAATPQGLFQVDITGASATELYQGLTTSDIQWVEATAAGDIYVATRRGAFVGGGTQLALESGAGNPAKLSVGPDINAVQEAAMRYNHVHPQRTEQQFEDAKRSAWYPELSLGYTDDREEQYEWEADMAETYYHNPPDDKQYKISLNWDFSEVIWNPDRRQISSNARMIQRERNDILEEVNRIYYERRRLVRELSQMENPESAQAMQKQLRIEELTATLDAYTGGFFSRQLRQMN